MSAQIVSITSIVVGGIRRNIMSAGEAQAISSEISLIAGEIDSFEQVHSERAVRIARALLTAAAALVGPVPGGDLSHQLRLLRGKEIDAVIDDLINEVVTNPRLANHER